MKQPHQMRQHTANNGGLTQCCRYRVHNHHRHHHSASQRWTGAPSLPSGAEHAVRSVPIPANASADCTADGTRATERSNAGVICRNVATEPNYTSDRRRTIRRTSVCMGVREDGAGVMMERQGYHSSSRIWART